MLVDSIINCHSRVGRKSLFVLSSVFDNIGRLWVEVIIVTFLDAEATVDMAGTEHRSQVQDAALLINNGGRQFPLKLKLYFRL